MPLDNENAADDFDLTQEIARSGFADMLHDTDRNRRYKQALKSVIDEKHKRDELVHVVDIGKLIFVKLSLRMQLSRYGHGVAVSDGCGSGRRPCYCRRGVHAGCRRRQTDF